MQKNIVWTGMKRLFAALAAALSLVGCTKTSVAPSQPLYVTDPAGAFVFAGTVSARGNDGAIAPLRGVSIDAISGTHRRTAVSGEDGTFVVDGLGEGVWTITLSKAGYVGYSQNVTLDGDMSNMTFELDPQEEPRQPREPQVSRVRR